MAEQRLNVSQAGPALQEVRRERVPEEVRVQLDAERPAVEPDDAVEDGLAEGSSRGALQPVLSTRRTWQGLKCSGRPTSTSSPAPTGRTNASLISF